MKIVTKLKHYTLIDILFMGYLLVLSLLILFFNEGVEGWYNYILIHLGAIFFLLFFVPVLNNSSNRFLNFLRWWYPILLFTFLYKEINAFTRIIVHNWQDFKVMQFEEQLLGVNLTLWLEEFISPFLTELMKFSYFSYYLMIPVGAAFLYFSGKRKHYIRFLSTICLAFFISYIGFILFPVRGPRYTLYDKYTKDYEVNIGEFYGSLVEPDVAGMQTFALKGGVFTSMQDYIMRYGSLHGGCMPSSHVAVAFVCMMMMWLYRRKVFYVYLPLVILLSVSVVYNRYHYVSDVIAGLAVGLLAFYLTPLLQRRWEGVREAKKQNI
ncbi:MAG: phosphatase PAP2 family protein [Elusimicrobiota bacterium]